MTDAAARRDAAAPVIAIAWPKPDYITSLEAAGATVRVLDPGADRLPSTLDAVDGVLLTGGVDVDPREYGEIAHPTVEIDPARDAYELALARETLARNLPLLAICRGAQVLNVAAGGTLIQDLPSQLPSGIDHSVTTPKHAIAHDVTIAPSTCLATLLGTGPVAVNSRHHQAVKDTAPGFVVSATAPDGVIEAIERPDAAFCVGVQWHPENFVAGGEFRPLFDQLVRSASRAR
jgi:putative glutamine amidotransferase